MPFTTQKPASQPASVKQRLHQMVLPADTVLTLRINTGFAPIEAQSLQPADTKVYRPDQSIPCHQVTFEEAVATPLVQHLPLQHPIQTGRESVDFPAKIRHYRPKLKPLSCKENTALISQIPMRWSLITLDQLDQATCIDIGQQVRQALKNDPLASYWRTQGVYAPVYPNKVFKVLRHPSGYLIGLPGHPADAEDKPGDPHYVVWLSAGKSKSQLIWIRMKTAC